MLKPTLCRFVFILSVAAPSTCFAQTWSSQERQTHLVELFTSEGCSSCPPADQWFNKLKVDKTIWKEFVPIVFHVDYWNYLGWTDPLSDAKYAARQREYAKAWRNGSVYTPGVVLDGKEWRDWRRTSTVPTPNKKEKAKVGTLQASKAGNNYQISFHPTAEGLAKGYQVHAAVLVMDFVSQVKSGENSGETLEHNFSACALKETVLSKSASTYEARITNLSCDRFPKNKKAIAIWVTAQDAPYPLQSTGGLLP